MGFEHPDWYNGFEHDPEEAARVRVGLLRELAANRESLVATHLSSRPFAMWWSMAARIVGYRAPGSTDRMAWRAATLRSRPEPKWQKDFVALMAAKALPAKATRGR